ncbi:PREDICTED: uncharacterized protein LOC104823758 [Tarenaya hassleriana]|uniref:uncharacterized protein LOC104823758 n=1 Tax=Tarenaya hassleriana TaxID=28532 RepID=UPI00053C601E|nr:PREDICTED: uncharacterized protein LOC104823758 [Tarenaya hassleriana]
MPCLLSCFSASKHKKRRLFIKSTSSTDPRRGDHEVFVQAKELENQKPVQTTSETTATSGVKPEERRVIGNVNLFEGLPVEVISDGLIKQDGGKEGEKSGEERQIARVVRESSEHKGSQSVVPESTDVSQNRSRTHRSLKDLAFEGFEETGDQDGEKGRDFLIEESSESLFSLSIDSRRRVKGPEFDGDREVTSPVTKQENVPRMAEAKLMEDGKGNDEEQVLELVLNPITDQKTVKVNKEKLEEDFEKENLSAGLDLSGKKKLADKETAVDTSLSSWLVESSGANSIENSDSKSRSSPNDRKGRPVLGELSLQEPKTEVVSISKSNTIGPDSDDAPLLGTIGSYLSCTEKTRNRMIAI